MKFTYASPVEENGGGGGIWLKWSDDKRAEMTIK
jgi:TATA-binding protein-associated factor Taf7